MSKKLLRVLSVVLALAMLASLCITSVHAEGFKTYKDSKMADYLGDYNEKLNPREKTKAAFTTAKIVVDGKADEAYKSTQVTKIDNTVGGEGYGIKGKELPKTYGELRTVWDGTTLYVLVDVYDAEVRTLADLVPGAQSSNPVALMSGKTMGVTQGWFGPSYGPVADLDALSIGLDLYNDKQTSDTDTHGVITFDPLGKMFFFRNSSIPSLGSPLGDPTHPEYMNVIKAYAAAPLLDAENKQIGYSVEVAFYVGDTDPKNGTEIGLDIQIDDYNEIVTGTEEVDNPEFDDQLDPSPENPEKISQDVKEVKKSAGIFWSHAQEAVYTDFNHEHTNAVDWGTVTLDGHKDEDYAVDDWKLKKLVEFIESPTFPTGVYTPESQAALDAALPLATTIVKSSYFNADLAEEAYEALSKAFYGLRWADTKYPDPMDLPVENTLPNPYKFFQSDRMVETVEDWEDRKNEILDLAQFYEYGYKPEYDKLDIKSVTYFPESQQQQFNWWTYQMEWVTVPAYYSMVVTVTVGEVSKDLTIKLDIPTDATILAQGHKAPVVLGYGSNDTYKGAGIAVATVPTVTGGDTRSNEYVWGSRSGVFYELYPYSRNGEGALKEVSATMAQAWAASLTIDALQMLKDSEVGDAQALYNLIDTEKFATTGFSYQGKYAFVSAVFDERVGVCIPGASGASGSSPWRYVYRGQVHDFRDTMYANANRDASVVEAFGTEILANSVRHNRVRETELFRHFLTFGHFCGAEEGAYGYATRLPYDQNDLIAAMAPRAVIIHNTVNDYNDGSVSDALSIEVAKSVYNALGYDGDDLLKFNYNSVYTAGDPHHSETAQYVREAEYMNYYWYGVEMSEETDERLSTDPFALDICDDQKANVYDFYWGGFNTITGGKDGVNGTDGWYYYQLKWNGITFTDGADGEVFEDVFVKTVKGEAVPKFTGSTEREGYLFNGWKYFSEFGLEIAEDKLADCMGTAKITAVAQWVNQSSTGDYANIALYASMMVLMGAAAIVAFRTRKEER